MNNLYESILSNVDTGLDNMDKAITSVNVIKKLKQLKSMHPVKDKCDCYGRKLEIGDIIAYFTNLKISFGIIMEFKKNDWLLVTPTGDYNNDKIKHEVFANETFKLTDKQFFELTKDIR